MATSRNLKQDEVNEAKKVFKNSIEYQKVYIQEHDGGVMVFAYYDTAKGWHYIIFWNNDVYARSAILAGEARTFIHEMTHVWQGQHSTYPREYMIRSGASQTKGVFEDAWEKGGRELVKRVWKEGPIDAWHSYRDRAYAFSMNDIGGYNFNEFNVEQQASIIESWYAPNNKKNHLQEDIPGGNMSTFDVRYPFITCNILSGSPNAQYTPLQSQANKAPQLANGADPKIKAIQDILVNLSYLDPKYAGGFMNKQTRDAVRGFQGKNGLKVDGDIGGPNSETRKKLGVR